MSLMMGGAGGRTDSRWEVLRSRRGSSVCSSARRREVPWICLQARIVALGFEGANLLRHP